MKPLMSSVECTRTMRTLHWRALPSWRTGTEREKKTSSQVNQHNSGLISLQKQNGGIVLALWDTKQTVACFVGKWRAFMSNTLGRFLEEEQDLNRCSRFKSNPQQVNRKPLRLQFIYLLDCFTIPWLVMKFTDQKTHLNWKFRDTQWVVKF